jgi:hypothetical protein
MNFVNPGFLYGLFAVSVPIIIHLFNFRRFRKIHFTNVSLIRDLKLQTQKQSKLRHLLVLLLRIIAIIALVMAFAQPYIPVAQSNAGSNLRNNVDVYIDNSFSMEAGAEKGSLLEEAREKAKEIAGMYKSSDLFRIITNDFEGRHQRYLSREEFLNLVNEIQISPVSRTIPEIISRHTKTSDTYSQNSRVLFVLSDFQKSLVAGEFEEADTTTSLVLIPLKGSNRDNLYIDSCWFVSPVHQLGQNSELRVRLKNSSHNSYERLPVKLKINGQQKALASFDIKADQGTEVVLPINENEPGIRNAVAEINDDAVTFDDHLYFSFTVSKSTSILCVNGAGENVFLNSLFGKDSAFVFQNVSQGNIDYSGFAGWQLIILNEVSNVSTGMIQELVKFTEKGGSLVVVPSGHISPEIYTPLFDALQTGYFGTIDTADNRINRINLDHPVFENVFDEIPENIDLPVVFSHYPIITRVRSRHEPLLNLLDGSPFLSEFISGKGKVYLIASPIQAAFSNFPRHAIFVPTLFKIAISSVADEQLFYTIGREEEISISNTDIPTDEVIHIKALVSGFDFIPENRRMGPAVELFPQGQIRQDGNYALTIDSKPIRGISFNYDRAESVMEFLSAEELNGLLQAKGLKNVKIIESTGKPFEKALADITSGIRLWRWFVVLTLLCLLGETLLLRFKK